MSHSLSLPPAIPPPPERDYFDSQDHLDPARRSFMWGLLGVIIIQLLLLLLAPWLFKPGPHALPKRRPPQTFNIEMPPETFLKPPPKIQQRFVEANPNAPENIPDKTNNFSDRNQQVAQEKPQANQHSDMPQTEGRKDVNSNAIVTGRLTKPQEAVPPTKTEISKTPSVAKPKAEQTPLTGFEKKVGDNPDGIGTNIARPSDLAKNIPNQTTGSKDVPLIQNPNVNEAEIDPKRPRARPALDRSNVRSAVLSEHAFGTSNAGVQAVDSRFNNYGVYLKRLEEEVEMEWYKILEPMNTAGFQGTHVTIRFRLNSKGQIEEIVDTQTTSPDEATRACASAITVPAPYGAWTPDMIAVLGNEQELVFGFYYE